MGGAELIAHLLLVDVGEHFEKNLHVFVDFRRLLVQIAEFRDQSTVSLDLIVVVHLKSIGHHSIVVDSGRVGGQIGFSDGGLDVWNGDGGLSGD